MSAYKCPCCGIETREKESTNKKGKLVVREIIYNCGTVAKIVNDGMSFKTYVEKAEKCLGSNLVAI